MKQEAEGEDLGNSQARDWLRHHSDVTTDKAREGTGKKNYKLSSREQTSVSPLLLGQEGSQRCPFCSGNRPRLRDGRKEQMTGEVALSSRIPQTV